MLRLSIHPPYPSRWASLEYLEDIASLCQLQEYHLGGCNP